ncbi:hypothetical protein RhiirA1_401061 [Rhizophagus irregularis]|uniref:Uncharacterized protein n=1 Tax=Rhizophagus irregularis TaxID=588596 RepID=A0A2N0R3Q4_9GLOM|nr:hypothetical protein RhiirA1_401061 [Rhizophagus irregularis]
MAILWMDRKPCEFLMKCGASSFKIIQTSKGRRKLVAYFENWETTLKALDTPQFFVPDDDPRGVKSHPRTMFFEVMNTRLVSEELANGKILEHIATTIAVKILLIVKNSLMVLFNTDGQSYYNAQETIGFEELVV